jgi:hypothetical protein
MISRLSTFSGPISTIFKKITSSTSVVTNGLVLYYDPSNSQSYPGTGNTIYDLSGNSLHGSMSNISFTSSYFTYNGTSSQISITDNSLLEPGSGSWTMEAWVNQTVSGNDVVLGKFDNGGLSEDVSYSLRTTGTNYYGQYSDGSGTGATLFQNSITVTASVGNWYQIVLVWKNGAVKTLETFVNGLSIGTSSHSLTSLVNTANNLYIGSYNGGEYTQYFDGKIGVVRLYNTALTQADVYQNFSADASKYGLVYDEIREQLTESQRITYDAATDGNWIKVTQTQYDNIATNVLGTTKYRDTDSNFTAGSSQWGSPFFLVGGSASFYIPADNYIVAYKFIAGRTNETYSTRIYQSNTYSPTASSWTALGVTNSFVTGASANEVAYYVRKKPSSVTPINVFIAIYSSNNLKQSVGTPTYLSSNFGTSFTTYASTNSPALQVLATPTKSW